MNTIKKFSENNVFNKEILKDCGYNLEEVIIELSGINREYNIIYISDLHIGVISEEVSDLHKETVENRIEMFKTPCGFTAKESWEQLSEILDNCHADAVLLGGDMIDFASVSNVKQFVLGCNKIKTPVMFVGADHDFCSWWCNDVSKDAIRELYESINATSDLQIIDLDDLYILGINNNTSQADPKTEEHIKEIITKKKPVILLQHVPLKSFVDDSLSEKSKCKWNGRILAWGEDCEYIPNDSTARLHNVIYQNGDVFKMVLSGHMHLSWDGLITTHIRQHVFKEAISGTIGVVKIKKSSDK